MLLRSRFCVRSAPSRGTLMVIEIPRKATQHD
jgi:hypothetical protein